MARKRKNHYEVLEVDSNVSCQELQKSFDNLLQRDYPTTAYPSPGKSFVKIRRLKEAYAVLSDPKKRKEYDLSLASSGVQVPTRSKKESSPSIQAPEKTGSSSSPPAEQKKNKIQELSKSFASSLEKIEKTLKSKLLSATPSEDRLLYLIAEESLQQTQSILTPLFHHQKKLAIEESIDLKKISNQMATLLYQIAVLYSLAGFPREAESTLGLSQSYAPLNRNTEKKIQQEVITLITSSAQSTNKSSAKSPPSSNDRKSSSPIEGFIKKFPGGLWGLILTIIFLLKLIL